MFPLYGTYWVWIKPLPLIGYVILGLSFSTITLVSNKTHIVVTIIKENTVPKCLEQSNCQWALSITITNAIIVTITITMIIIITITYKG